MNTYSIEKLRDLAKTIDKADIYGGSQDTPEAALNNVFCIVNDYYKKGLDAIHDKMLEFANIGRALPYKNGETHPHLMVYRLIYEFNIKDIPLYMNSPYEIIALWRLNIPQGTL